MATADSVAVGLLATLSAKPGKESAAAKFLAGALPLAQQEDKTITFYAIKLDEQTYGIVDFFADDSGRQAHLNGPLAAASHPPKRPRLTRHQHISHRHQSPTAK